MQMKKLVAGRCTSIKTWNMVHIKSPKTGQLLPILSETKFSTVFTWVDTCILIIGFQKNVPKKYNSPHMNSSFR